MRVIDRQVQKRFQLVHTLAMNRTEAQGTKFVQRTYPIDTQHGMPEMLACASSCMPTSIQ